MIFKVLQFPTTCQDFLETGFVLSNHAEPEGSDLDVIYNSTYTPFRFWKGIPFVGGKLEGQSWDILADYLFWEISTSIPPAPWLCEVGRQAW